MSLQLKSIHLVSGPEKARGGEQTFIGVEAVFLVHGTTIRSAGFGIVKEETDAGMKAAIESAVKQAGEIAKESYDPFETPSGGVPVAALKAVAKIASGSAVANAKLKGNQQTVDDLSKPADDIQQKQIDQVCNELGIQPIPITGLERGSVLCMLKALESLLTEAKPNPDGD